MPLCCAVSITVSIAAVRQFLKKQAVERADMIVVAGGAKTLASPRNDFEQAFILEQVRMSIRLHQTRRVMVMSHTDCATYGGLAHFKGDREPKPSITAANFFVRENCLPRTFRAFRSNPIS